MMTATGQITPMQRSRGEARVALDGHAVAPRLAGLRQAGSAKVILPRVDGPPELVFLNTSGGLTGGDVLVYGVDLGPGVVAVATTQTAERAYRASAGVARVRVELSVGEGGFLDWLPQETILFNGAALDRRTELRLAPGAGCLLLETVVLGRAAMGETLTRIGLRDWRVISRDGQPLWVEPLTLTDATLCSGGAGLAGARAFATLCLVQDGAEALLSPLRAMLAEPGVQAAASAFPGRLVLRAQAADGWPLRRLVARCLGLLRGGRALPRVWQI
jgi:urease accessory protein